MGKAKMFGGTSLIVGLILGILSYMLVKSTGASFMTFLIGTYLPVLFISIGLIAIVIGVLLLIYG